MNEAPEITPAPSRQSRGALLGYAIAMLAYTGVGFVTQEFLTFSDGLLYFVVTLEVIPRCYRYFRYGDRRPPFRPGAAP